jgi:hypothetical protein
VLPAHDRAAGYIMILIARAMSLLKIVGRSTLGVCLRPVHQRAKVQRHGVYSHIRLHVDRVSASYSSAGPPYSHTLTHIQSL